jgi:hypothetical protein
LPGPHHHAINACNQRYALRAECLSAIALLTAFPEQKVIHAFKQYSI